MEQAIMSDMADKVVPRTGRERFKTLAQAAMNVDPDGILEATVSVPAADVVPDADELIITNAGSITLS